MAKGDITKLDNGDSVYYGKDNRLRVYVRDTGKTISYPKYLMEKELGRQLLPGEDVHHRDGNPLNNDLSNLRVMTRSEHMVEHLRRFQDATAICGWCGREFTWTAKQQETFYSNRRNHHHKTELPFCSRECSGRYGRQQQIKNGACGSRTRKLTDADVRYIRTNYISRDPGHGARALARQFGVDKSVVEKIVQGRTYKDIV